MNPQISQLLKSHPTFQDLDEPDILDLVNISEIVPFQKDDLIFTEAQESTYLYLIATGSFQLKLRNNKFKTLAPGELFGEIGIIDNAVRSGTIRAKESSTAVRICGSRLFKADHIRPQVALHICLALARKITGYLRSREQISTRKLIEMGETEFVEFKASLRMDLASNAKSKAIELGILKSIAGFLNGQGGTLLIGVTDEGEILGLTDEQFTNTDKFILHLTNMIKRRMGPLSIDFVHFEIAKFDELFILRVDCEPSTRPIFTVDGSHEYFFLRTGPSTSNLKMSKAFPYIKKRFGFDFMN